MTSTVATAQPQTRRYTVAQYLALEEETGEKWEFFDGEVYVWEAMAGSTPPHARICNKLAAILENGLKGSGCGSFSADLKLSIHDLNRYRYPDLSVICGDLEYDRDIPQAVLNPRLLVEVTSESSGDADHTSKAKQYMEHVPALRDYLIVEQHECFATLYSRTEKSAPWTVEQFSDLQASIEIRSVNLKVTLGDVYQDIVWEKGKAVVHFAQVVQQEQQ